MLFLLWIQGIAAKERTIYMPPTSLIVITMGAARRKGSSDIFSITLVVVPFASNDYDGYTARMREFAGEAGYEMVGLHECEDPLTAVQEMEGIYVGGGNSFLLVKELYDRGLIEPVRERVLSGVPYLGVSAGANVACPTMMTTNDMPIVLPPSFESFGIVPFQINPHYHPGKILYRDGDEIAEHYGESRAQRISEYHRTSDTPVLGIWEGSFVHWDGFEGRLTGRATVFSPGKEQIVLLDGSEFGPTLERQ